MSPSSIRGGFLRDDTTGALIVSGSGGSGGGAAALPTYILTVSGSMGSATYTAYNRAGTVAATATDTGAVSGLKTVIDALKAAGVWFHFAAGTFSFLDDVSGQFNATFNTIHGLTFSGEGIENTIIRSLSNAVTGSDSEPLSFTHCHRGTMRDLQLRCEGADRQTSDAFDLDGGSDWLLERVWVSYSRGNGFHIDGKDDAAWPVRHNVFRECIAENCRFDGFEFLAAEDSSLVECVGRLNGGHGAQITKGSSGASIPNKKSARNRIIGGTYDENGADGINILSSDDNVIDGATCLNNANVTASKDGVRIETANSISADRNRISVTASDTQGVKTQRYGVNVQPALAAEANDNIVDGSSLAGNLTRGGNDTGTGTRWGDNAGFVTRNGGSYAGNGNGSATAFTVSHGLDRTPTKVVISPTGPVSAAGDAYVSAKAATNFTITFPVAPVTGTGNVLFDWEARY